jgi:hypothetical protein
MGEKVFVYVHCYKGGLHIGEKMKVGAFFSDCLLKWEKVFSRE